MFTAEQQLGTRQLSPNQIMAPKDFSLKSAVLSTTHTQSSILSAYSRALTHVCGCVSTAVEAWHIHHFQDSLAPLLSQTGHQSPISSVAFPRVSRKWSHTVQPSIRLASGCCTAVACPPPTTNCHATFWKDHRYYQGCLGHFQFGVTLHTSTINIQSQRLCGPRFPFPRGTPRTRASG